MKRLQIYLFSLILSTIFLLVDNVYSQNIIDTIFTEDFDTIPCQITSVSHYSIYYKYQKGKRLKSKIMPRIFVDRFVLYNIGISIKEQKFNSEINAYIKKSKLDKKYEPLMLKDNTNSTLKIIGDSIFVQRKNDYLLLALKITSFARKHRCKLIYIAEMQNESDVKVHITLYDASDEYYQQVHDSYNLNKVLLFRSNHITEYAEIDIKINDSIFSLQKNEYYEYDFNILSDTLEVNKGFLGESDLKLVNDKDYNNYYYVGNSSNYSNKIPIIIPLFLLGGAGFIVISVNNDSSLMNNFVGEFVKMNLNKYSGTPRLRKGLRKKNN